ncbi:hypothetical protein ACHHYP_09725 [Achlya hypogyna]|uniref:Uncharacterized protein n=1 Tax=Achlya hypogyna TaxID=1202772 RepID=A0A1V9YMI9_ACHHY|nr:hypothetical protein ACHHYP_09725 [Achlya hypogyna]
MVLLPTRVLQRSLVSSSRSSGRLETLHRHLKAGDVGRALSLRAPGGSKLDAVADFVATLETLNPALANKTAAFFVQREVHLASTLLRAYQTLNVELPAMAIKDMLMAVTQAGETRAALQVLAMAQKQRITVPPEAMLQCFLSCEATDERGARDPRPFIAPFLALATDNKIDLTYPHLGASIVHTCLKLEAIPEALAIAAVVRDTLPASTVNLVDNLGRLAGRPEFQSMWVQFALCNNKDVAEPLFVALQASFLALDASSTLLGSLATVLFHQGKHSLGCAAVDASLSHHSKAPLPGHVFATGFGGMTVSSYGLSTLLRLLWVAIESDQLESTSFQHIDAAIRACLRNDDVPSALRLYAYWKSQCTPPPTRFTVTMDYLAVAPEACHSHLLQFLVHRRHDAAMDLFDALVAADVRITSKTLKDMVMAVHRTPGYVVRLLEYALQHGVALPVVMATTLLSKGGRDDAGVVDALLNLLEAGLVPTNGIVLGATVAENDTLSPAATRAVALGHNELHRILTDSVGHAVDVTGIVAFLVLQQPDESMALFRRCAGASMVLTPRTLVALIRHGAKSTADVVEVVEYAKATQCVLPGHIVGEILDKCGADPMTVACLVDLMASRMVTLNGHVLRSILYASRDKTMVEKCMEMGLERGIDLPNHRVHH